MRYNINGIVHVQLTDVGRKELDRQAVEFLKEHPHVSEFAKYVEDNEGWSPWQMWDLMSRLGHLCGNGLPAPFDTIIKMKLPNQTPKESPEEQQKRQDYAAYLAEGNKKKSKIRAKVAIVYDVGYADFDEIEALGSRSKVYFVTARRMDDRLLDYSNRACGIIKKPFNLDDILEVVNA